jgi:hypothetical protein
MCSFVIERNSFLKIGHEYIGVLGDYNWLRFRQNQKEKRGILKRGEDFGWINGNLFVLSLMS